MPSETDRRALADEIEIAALDCRGDDDAIVSILMAKRDWRSLIAALRADPDRAAGEREAAERMRVRCISAALASYTVMDSSALSAATERGQDLAVAAICALDPAAGQERRP